MKELYLNLSMGCAGDMLSAALLELMPDPDAALEKLNAIGIPHVVFEAEKSEKCGIVGTHMSVKIHGHEEGEEHEHHHHNSMEDIRAVIENLKVSDRVKADVIKVYEKIAEAESHVHGRPVTEIHFHEVGALDAIADVTAVCWLMEQLKPDAIRASAVHVGSGTVKCAHGILPVPAPATAYILQDVPCYGGSIKGELCTPTGAALLKYFVKSFGDMPTMRVKAIGYGMGKKDFPAANTVRAMLGETDTPTEQIVMLHFNVDDMTAEEIAFSTERMFEAGAVEVFTVPIGMKKCRPGTMVCAICHPEKKENVLNAIFRNTSTLGVRESVCTRHVLGREFISYDTPFGAVRAKISEGYGVRKEKLEYEDLARIAKEQGISIAELRSKIEKNI